MKYQWETSDVLGGRKVGRPGCKEPWMIAYSFDGSPGEPVFSLVSLRDGLVTGSHTKPALAEYLTVNGWEPTDLRTGWILGAGC